MTQGLTLQADSSDENAFLATNDKIFGDNLINRVRMTEFLDIFDENGYLAANDVSHDRDLITRVEMYEFLDASDPAAARRSPEGHQLTCILREIYGALNFKYCDLDFVPNNKRRLLCPLYCLDPTTCEADLTLLTLENVIDHLVDAHYHEPLTTCPDCYGPCKTIREAVWHHMDAGCKIRLRPLNWGLQPSQADDLKTQAKANRHDVKTMYDTILTAMHPSRGGLGTRSPYLGAYDTWVVNIVTRVVRRHGRDLERRGGMEGKDPEVWYVNHITKALLAPKAEARRARFVKAG